MVVKSKGIVLIPAWKTVMCYEYPCYNTSFKNVVGAQEIPDINCETFKNLMAHLRNLTLHALYIVIKFFFFAFQL